MAGSALWDEPVNEPVDELLRNALHALRDRVTEFRARTPRPSPRVVDDFWLRLSGDFDAAVAAATGRDVERWAASLQGPRPKGKRGRPPSRRLRVVHTKKYRPFVDDSETPIVMRAMALVKQAALDGRRVSGGAALDDVFREHLLRDAATRTTFEGRFRYHYDEADPERPGSERRAQRAAVRSMVDRKRFARIERRLRRELSRGR